LNHSRSCWTSRPRDLPHSFGIACPVLFVAFLVPCSVRAEEFAIAAALVSTLDEVQVPATEEGLLGGLSIKAGDAVTAGQALGKIDDERILLAEQKAAIELEIAKKEAANRLPVLFAEKSLEVARAELERAENSNRDFPGSVSKSEMDKLRLAVDQASLHLQQTEHEWDMSQLSAKLQENALETARAEVKRRTLSAPFDGILVEVNGHVGEWVMPGDTVFRVVRNDRLKVEGLLPIDKYRQVRRGTTAHLEIAADNGSLLTFPGEITFVSPEFDPINKQTRIWAEVDNLQNQLQPGLRGTLIVHSSPAVQADPSGGSRPTTNSSR
jgi:RND family efflux transporter MFP subunit